MKYEIFRDGVDLYSWPNEEYFDAINYLKNKDLGKLTNEDINNSITPFFRLWMRALRVSWSSPRIVDRICKKINESAPFLNRLKNKELDKIIIDEEIKTSIKTVFKNIANISVKLDTFKERRLGVVGASKIMHILLPDLIIMWDKDIRYAYDCVSNDEEGDFIKFIEIMKDEAKELLDCSNKTKKEICRECYPNNEVTLLKLIDEYNFTFTRQGYLLKFKSVC